MNYRNVANLMMAMPANREKLPSQEFLKVVKKRNFKFKYCIDKLDGVYREVWGNSTFAIIVLRQGNTFVIL